MVSGASVGAHKEGRMWLTVESAMGSLLIAVTVYDTTDPLAANGRRRRPLVPAATPVTTTVAPGRAACAALVTAFLSAGQAASAVEATATPAMICCTESTACGAGTAVVRGRMACQCATRVGAHVMW